MKRTLMPMLVFQTAFGNLNSFLLDSFWGLDETIQYQNGGKRLQEIKRRSDDLGELQRELNHLEASQKSVTNLVILLFSFGMLFAMGELYLSGGEKQRIGIARAFLHNAPFLLLDEPTSSLDSLNEGIILKSLKESCEKKTVVLVSHRTSTMNLADVVYEMDSGRIS